MIALANEYKVVLDTCVLAPMPLADTLLRLAEEPGLFAPYWSSDILSELRAVLLRFGYSEQQADRRIAVMREHFEEAEVTGFESLIPVMANEEKDRHVLAAAVTCGAHAIVTQNGKDFPESALKPFGIELLGPDEFLLHQYHLNSVLVLEKITRQGERHPAGLPGLLKKLVEPAPTFVAALCEEMGLNLPGSSAAIEKSRKRRKRDPRHPVRDQEPRTGRTEE